MLRRILSGLLVLSAGLSALADQVSLNTQPSGAVVRIIGPADAPQLRRETTQWITPATADIARNRAGQPYVVQITKENFQTETVTLDVRGKQLSLNVNLAPLNQEEEVSINSEPAGATIYNGNQIVGKTPLNAKFLFTRKSKDADWSRFQLRAELAGHQGETFTITKESATRQTQVILGRISDHRSVKITATNQKGQPIENAIIELNGKAVGTSPALITIPFERASKTAPWPTFKLALEIPDEYQRSERTIELSNVGNLNFELTPVTELNVVKYFPIVEMTPRGPKLSIDTTTTIGSAVLERDDGTAAEATTRITNFERKGQFLMALNSFAITPDGQSLIYAATYRAEDGRYYSNLHLRSTNASNATSVQLTRGFRFMDINPTMCREAESRLVVFQSNRSNIDNFDISSFRIADNRLVGGIQQLTREAKFSFKPSFVSEAQPIYFNSMEQFPQAEPRFTSVRADGSAYTNHGEVGEMLNYVEGGRIYFSRFLEDTKTYQLFSILTDGTGIETLLSDPEFAFANCHSPVVSPDGQRLVFVSDHNPDKSSRKENNLWLLDLSGTRRPIQLTNNPSDDINPVWSPTEPDVLYFMSNRRGAYNIWKLVFRVSH